MAQVQATDPYDGYGPLEADVDDPSEIPYLLGIPQETYEKLRQVAVKRGISVPDVLRLALREFFAKEVPNPTPKRELLTG